MFTKLRKALSLLKSTSIEVPDSEYWEESIDLSSTFEDETDSRNRNVSLFLIKRLWVRIQYGF